MLKRSLKGRCLSGVVAVLMFFYLSAYALKDGDGSTPSHGTNSARPPVEQTLIPEGLFAVQLAQALQIERTEDVAVAEKRLSELSIAPKNGWISEFPVTPEVIGDIDKAVATAAETGLLQLGKTQALQALSGLKTKLGLNVSVDAMSMLPPMSESKTIKIYKYRDKQGGLHITNDYESIPEEYRKSASVIEQTLQVTSSSGITVGADTLASAAKEYSANPDQDVIDEYYAVSGPPVVTYYTPPVPYLYLYSWTPQPFWCGGLFFRGFFLLRDFHKHIRFGNKPFIVSNHFGRGDFRHRHTSGSHGGMPNAGIRPSNSFYSTETKHNAQAIFRHNDKRRSMSSISPGPRITTQPIIIPENLISPPRVTIPQPVLPQRQYSFPIPDTNKMFEGFSTRSSQDGGFAGQNFNRGSNARQR
ncbi:MAG: hypothetical protein ACU837_01350 [Gammaproteobacteria bacterium]